MRFVIGQKVRIKGNATTLEVKSVNDYKLIDGKREKVAVVGYTTKEGESRRKEYLQDDLEVVKNV